MQPPPSQIRPYTKGLLTIIVPLSFPNKALFPGGCGVALGGWAPSIPMILQNKPSKGARQTAKHEKVGLLWYDTKRKIIFQEA